MPALPLDGAGPYVAGAYTLFVVVLVLYVAIMSRHVGRVSRELEDLSAEVERDRRG